MKLYEHRLFFFSGWGFSCEWFMVIFQARGRGTATGLRGVIVGSGILCFCSACNGNEVSNMSFK